MKACYRLKFIPFDPIHKRTESTIEDGDKDLQSDQGRSPGHSLTMSLDAGCQRQAQKAVDELAAKGYRTLGVARADHDDAWQFLGLLPLFDPPREDSAATIAEAQAHGIKVKMITGDNQAIGREIARQLGLGTDIQPATNLFPAQEGCACDLTAVAISEIEKADGFAQVFPEHKYLIVKALQENGVIWWA